MPPGDPRVGRLADHVLSRLEQGRGGTGSVNVAGRVRAHATQDGYALAALSLLGLATSARVRRLAEFHGVTGHTGALRSARRAAEFFLRHRMFRSARTGRVIHDGWLRFRFPPYWHYDVLQGLWVLARLGPLDDPRAGEALNMVAERRRGDGMWRADGRHWKPPGSRGSNVEIIDWGRRGPNEWVTLRALRVLKAANRWP